MRAIAAGSAATVRRACTSYPKLSQYIYICPDVCMWTDVHAFHRQLAELSRQSLGQRTAELEASDAPEDHKTLQLHRLT
eukprot:2825576-Pyramimonas_sp.AAC.2